MQKLIKFILVVVTVAVLRKSGYGNTIKKELLNVVAQSSESWDLEWYFEPHEFDSPGQQGSGVKMKLSFIKKLNEARVYAGIAFIINSGFRTSAYNQSLIDRGYKASKNSSHLVGFACDIHCNDLFDMTTIYRSLKKAGFNRIGQYYTENGNYFIHVDSDPTKLPAEWTYFQGKKVNYKLVS